MTKLTNKKFTIDRTEPVSSQKWRKFLVVVATGNTRLVGTYDNQTRGAPDHVYAHVEGQFTLHGAMLYICNFSFQPASNGFQAHMGLHCLAPYDLSGAMSIQIGKYDHMLWAMDQPAEYRDWLYATYTDAFDPPVIKMS